MGQGITNSQGTAAGKNSNAPSGPQFDYAAANAGQPTTGATSGFQNAALAQGQSSQQNVGAQTTQNRPDQANAFGASVNWTTGPDGRPVQVQSLGGPLGGTESELQKQLLGANSTPLDNGAQARNSAENAIYGRETSRLDPQFNQAQEQMTTSLANQGLDPSSQAGSAQVGNFNRAKDDAYTSALQQAIMGGGQEASRQQQMDINSRMQPEQALSGLAALTQQPGFMGAGAAEPTQYLPASMAQYGGLLQKFGIEQAGKNSTMGGLSNIAKIAAMASM